MNPDTVNWYTSSLSAGGNCVEVATNVSGVHVRDTKHRAGGTLSFTHDEWRAFVNGVRNGEFDL
jgi:hypothetical protein